MAKTYNSENYYIDFSDSKTLNDEDKSNLESIQKNYRPVERVDELLDYKNDGRITDDEFEYMTGVPLQ